MAEPSPVGTDKSELKVCVSNDTYGKDYDYLKSHDFSWQRKVLQGGPKSNEQL